MKGSFVMKTVGIIAEYNPFHNGHLYQLRQLRARTGADYVIVVMSGDFVQRGEPAVYDKYTRTRMALAAGVDLVLELPVCFATGSAEDFAACGVALLDRLGVVDWLGFGSESGDCRRLWQVASVLAEEPEELRSRLLGLLKQGLSFPDARAQALAHFLCDPEESEKLGSLLLAPNNILGIEYLKALIRRTSRIQPVTIQRLGQDYHDTAFVGGEVLASASAIRSAIRENDFAMVRRQLPEKVFSLLQLPGGEDNRDGDSDQSPSPVPVFAEDLSGLLNYRLMDLNRTRAAHPLDVYADLSPDLALRLQHKLLEWEDFSGRIRQLKTRGYTYTRISRALLHLLLGITDEQISCCKKRDYVSYARILGFRHEARPLLGRIRQKTSLPLITKTADAHKILDDDGLAMLHMDFHASHLYQSLVFSKTGVRMKNEYTQSVILL